MQPSFIWVNGDVSKKSDVLNESVVCTMSASKVGVLPIHSCNISCNMQYFLRCDILQRVQPCELSIQLLNALREMLRTGCDHNAEGLDGEQLASMRHMSGVAVVG